MQNVKILERNDAQNNLLELDPTIQPGGLLALLAHTNHAKILSRLDCASFLSRIFRYVHLAKNVAFRSFVVKKISG